MDKTMTVREVRDELGKRVDAAYYAGETTVITKNGEPRALLVPLSQGRRRTDLTEHAEEGS